MSGWSIIFFLAALIFFSTMPLQTQAQETSTGQFILDPIFEAATDNDVALLQQRITSGVPIDVTNSEGRTALLLATHANAIEAAKFLIDAGADVNAMDQIQDSPFLYAGAEGKLEILKMTVAAGADLDSTNRYGGTALVPAAHHGHVEVVRYLLTTKINKDHVNKLGWTALLEAVVLGDGGSIYQQIVTLLVEAGADISIADNEGITPLQHAKRRSQIEVVRILESVKRN
jgi:uncharacterized protein